MMKCRAILVLLVVLSTGIGTTAEVRKNELPAKVQTILDEADQLELLSLDPSPAKGKAKGNFHGWLVLGKTVLEKAESRKRILDTVMKGIADPAGRQAKCFEPRHGIRATAAGKSVDLVICFACGRVEIHFGDERRGHVATSAKYESVLDKALKEAKIPLPKPSRPEE